MTDGLSSNHIREIGKKFRSAITELCRTRKRWGDDDPGYVYQDAVLALAQECDESFEWAERYELGEIEDAIVEIVDERFARGRRYA